MPPERRGSGLPAASMLDPGTVTPHRTRESGRAAAINGASCMSMLASPMSRHLTHRRRAQRHRYEVVAELLRQQMDAGLLPAGEKLPALRELAERYGASIGTVRRALRVLEQEERVYQVSDVGAFVAPPAARPASRRVRVALLAADLADAADLPIVQAVEHACQQRGWDLHLLDAQGSTILQARNCRRAAAGGGDAMVVLPTRHPSPPRELTCLQWAGRPVVLIERSVPGLDLDCVKSDQKEAGYLAARHLLRLGHERVHFVLDTPELPCTRDRMRGWEEALLEHGRQSEPEAQVEDPPWRARVLRKGGPAMSNACLAPRVPEEPLPTPSQRRRNASKAILPILRARELPLAFIAESDHSAWGIYEACRGLGLRVPEDISVLCLADSDIAQALSPPLTVLRPRTDEIARRAIKLIEERLGSSGAQPSPRGVRIGGKLIERGSVCRCNSEASEAQRVRLR
jgi:DNA-binding LacI/PurR family transcriptional regulator